jgi:hypothetical protein
MGLIAQIALGVIIGLAHAAEPTGTLTLACEGMETITHAKAVSPSMIINFATKTITGLDAPSVSGHLAP